MSINSRVDKHTVVSPHNGILRSDKHEETTDEHNDMDASQKHRAEWKKPVSKGYMLYASIYMTFSKSRTIGTERRPVAAQGWE